AVDIVVINRDDKPTVLRNIAGSRGHWVQLTVLDRDGREALHARVRLDAGGVSRWRRVERAYSYCASNDPRVHCGLGSATVVDKVTVFWEDGTTSEYGPLAVDRGHLLQQR
ncbi:MAG: CRTAC1 family protein, partial [Armatimonadetes bacterium]|nr:CRTAC1 family protein [Armatimonadota bacterium]